METFGRLAVIYTKTDSHINLLAQRLARQQAIIIKHNRGNQEKMGITETLLR
mgnify:CR=1 FL=1|jgi:hypothetical protein